MKKIFSALVVIGFLAVVLAVPLTTFAQNPPSECCTLKRAITLNTSSCGVGSIAAPNSAAAAECGTGIYCSDSAAKWGMFCVMNTLYSVTDWIFVILVALAGLFVILGAMNLIMSGGSAEKIKSGREYVMYAAIGLIVGLLAKAIPSLVRMIAGS